MNASVVIKNARSTYEGGPQVLRSIFENNRKVLAPSSRVGAYGLWCKGSTYRKAAADQPYEIAGIASTIDVDSSGDVVLPEGADMRYFLKNRTLFVDHCYLASHAVAKLRTLTMRPDGWFFRAAMLEDEERHPHVGTVRSLAQQGGIGVSIGFEYIDGRNPTEEDSKAHPGASHIITRWRCLEVSFTPLPCNVRCQTISETKRRIVVV